MHKALALQENAPEADGYLHDEIVRTVQEIHLKLASCEAWVRHDSETLNQEIAMARHLPEVFQKKIDWLSDAVASRQKNDPGREDDGRGWPGF